MNNNKVKHLIKHLISKKAVGYLSSRQLFMLGEVYNDYSGYLVGKDTYKPYLEGVYVGLQRLSIIGESNESRKVWATVSNTACAAGLRNFSGFKSIDYVIAHISNSEFEPSEDDQYFYEWLFQESPYSKAFITKSYKEFIKTRMAVIDASASWVLVIQACMLTRLPWEGDFNHITKLFKGLGEAGCDKNLALVMSHVVDPRQDRVKFGYSRFGHNAMQHDNLSPTALKAFVEGELPIETSSFSERLGYDGLSGAWAGNVGVDYDVANSARSFLRQACKACTKGAGSFGRLTGEAIKEITGEAKAGGVESISMTAKNYKVLAKAMTNYYEINCK